MDIDINNLSGYRENNRIEAKKAKGGLPGSLWETYSSFANTDGGIILLGVDEKDDHSFVVSGVEDVHKLKTDFWNMVNNRQKISLNVLTNEMVHEQEVEGKSILVIRVPKADRRQKPVYVGQDPMRGTYRRDFEITHNPDRTKLTIPYTIAALQKAGPKLVDTALVENSDTKDANSDTKEASSDTRKSNFDTNITTTLTPKQQKVLEYCVEPRNSREILEHIGVSTHSKNTKKYVTDLVKLGVLKMTNPATTHAPNQRYYCQSSGGEPTSKE